MDQLRAMKVFARVVDEGGFARAARALDMAPPVVTRMVAELEAHLGARLLNRTTRQVHVTADGAVYYERAVRVLVDLDAGTATDNWGGTDTLIDIENVSGSVLADRLTGDDGAGFGRADPGRIGHLGDESV